MHQRDRNIVHPPNKQSDVVAGELTVRQAGGKPCVLVVDDDSRVRALVQLVLKMYGFGVWSASTGHEALDLYQAHRKDIGMVLLDVQMPEMDGPQTLDALRERDPDVVACFMSGDLGTYEAEELLQRGASQVIAKPFHLDELANTLHRLTTGKPAVLLPSG